jgi:uncharacterized LabA/DUF88 family protein
VDYGTNHTKITSYPQTGVVIFDGGYWEKLRQELGSLDIDLEALSEALCEPSYRLRSYFFDGKLDKRQSFHAGIQMLSRFEVRLGDVMDKIVECPHCNKPTTTPTQKRVDVQLAVQLVHIATTKQVDLIVLLAGDRDFIPAIEIAKNSGVIIRLVHGPRIMTSSDLIQQVDERLELTEEFLADFQRKARKKTKRKHKIRIEKQKTVEPKKAPTKQVEKATKLVTDVLTNIIPDYSDQEWFASTVGIELSKKYPNWKKELGVKKLAALIELVDNNVASIHTKNGVSIIQTKKQEVLTKSIGKKPTKAKDFLIQVLKKEKIIKKGDKLSFVNLGIALSKEDSDWKKHYKIKNVDQLVQLLGNNIQTIGKGPRKELKVKTTI